MVKLIQLLLAHGHNTANFRTGLMWLDWARSRFTRLVLDWTGSASGERVPTSDLNIEVLRQLLKYTALFQNSKLISPCLIRYDDHPITLRKLRKSIGRTVLTFPKPHPRNRRRLLPNEISTEQM